MILTTPEKLRMSYEAGYMPAEQRALTSGALLMMARRGEWR